MTATANTLEPRPGTLADVLADLRALPDGSADVLMAVYRHGPLNFGELLVLRRIDEADVLAEVAAARGHLEYDAEARRVDLRPATRAVLDGWFRRGPSGMHHRNHANDARRTRR